MKDGKMVYNKQNRFYLLFVSVLLLSMVLYTECYDEQMETLKQELNNFGESLVTLVKELNNSSDNRSIDSIENSFDKMDQFYQRVYERIFNNKNKINKEALNYFNDNYIYAYQEAKDALNTLIKGNYSDESFIEYYNNVGQKINNLIRVHNNFIGILEK